MGLRDKTFLVLYPSSLPSPFAVGRRLVLRWEEWLSVNESRASRYAIQKIKKTISRIEFAFLEFIIAEFYATCYGSRDHLPASFFLLPALHGLFSLFNLSKYSKMYADSIRVIQSRHRWKATIYCALGHMNTEGMISSNNIAPVRGALTGSLCGFR